MSNASALFLGLTVLFFAATAVVIAALHQRPQSFADFAVAGRAVGWLPLTFSYLGAWYVGLIYTEWAALAAEVGVFAQYLLLYSLGSLIVLLCLARPVWTWGKRYRLETLADLIELRYGSKGFKLFFSVVVFLIGFPWLVFEIKIIGLIVGAVSGGDINPNLGMIAACLFVFVYCFYGGTRAAISGSIVQGAVVLAGALLFYCLMRRAFGGVFPLLETVAALKPELLRLEGDYRASVWLYGILTGILGGFCWPDIFNRIYMAESLRAIKKLICLAPFCGIVIVLPVLLLAMGATVLDGFPGNTQVVLFWIGEKYAGSLGLALTGLVALAACMSSFAAVVTAVASYITKDWLGFFKPGLSAPLMLKYARIITVFFGLLSLWVATMPLPDLISAALVMYDCIIQAIVPIIAGLYWRKGNLAGAAAGMAAGVAVTLAVGLAPAESWVGSWPGGLAGLAVNLALYLTLGLALPAGERVNELFNNLAEQSAVQQQGIKRAESIRRHNY